MYKNNWANIADFQRLKETFIFSTFATMKNFYSQKWNKKLFTSIQRHLCDYSDLIDFASNDYLGFAKDEIIKNIIQEQFDKLAFKGSTGSRLISGNKKWIEDIEHDIAHIHHSEDALIFPSAYQANVGLLSCIADRQDVYLLDEHCHASIYDGVRLSFAKYYKFKHNDFADLKKRIDTCYASFDTIYVVVEGLYSMEGDLPEVENLLSLIDNKKVFLIVDEAHSFGVMGKDHLGLFNVKELAQKCVARIIGYGKSLGFSGAAVVGSAVLKKYLVNFCRSFIYSTALPLYHYQVLALLYEVLLHSSHKQHQLLKQHINFYLSLIENRKNFSKNNSPIQYFRINEEHYQNIQHTLIENKIFAKVILPPTVPKGTERVRISLHSFNTTDEISHLVRTLQTFENE